MGYEIDFLPVGEESSGGDAIALRYGNLYGSRDEQTVVVIDGGYRVAGEALVEHIRERYDTGTVDLVVSTHPDQDHISGLRVVLEELDVKKLLMHKPWSHSTGMQRAKMILSLNAQALHTELRDSLQGATALEEVAKAQGVPIEEPFLDWTSEDGVLRVLGPTEDYYRELLAEIVEPDSEAAARASWEALVLHKLLAGTAHEDLDIETLGENGETSAKNNTSAICLLEVEGRKLLFTGDAGIPALGQALDVLEADGFQPGELQFVQVPHHGSRRNVSPSILNRLLGPKGQTAVIGTAFASVPKKNPEHKHPAKKTTNAFRRRGYPVHLTQGTTRCHCHDAPDREGYGTSTPEPLHTEVEDNGDK
ncbi:MBL fold metallo-hydrolase [Streptomyces sp. NBC_00285]|uniref:ComEC/Rec2 family competence protein n=1 Tax=Streptomyces sp. NBC_00285 TaxID=2975700 RepID=UPI002E2B4A5B|nr:MBL fold metallo-hydrolase [Streptomyces sp. NBC_00285]